MATVTLTGFKTTYLSNLYLDCEFGGQSFDSALPADLWIALFTVMPTIAGGGTEPTIGVDSYARLQVTRDGTNFSAAALQAITNQVIFDFGTPTGSGWGTIVGAGWIDAATSGNLLRAGPFSPTRAAVAGVPFFVPISAWSATEQ